jgi:1-acyl-sn-glycerol-3-phosphate acyltransferase
LEEESTSPVDRGLLVQLGPADLRRVLPPYLAGFVADGQASARNLARVARLVEAWSDDACGTILSELREVGSEHRLYPANCYGRVLSRAWTQDIVLDPTLEGIEHLRGALAQGPTLLLCNHLSYFDTSATDAVLAWTGHADLADRLVAVAGPKVYQDLFRLLAASCLNTLPVPQSTTLSHTEKLPPRELARRATASLDAAAAALTSGYVPLLYPEGSRSRTGHMGSFLRGTYRYLSCVEDLRVVPTAISGTERVMRVGHPKLTPGPVSLTFGAPLHVGPDGPPRDVLALAHERVASLLPDHLKPLPGTPAAA